ncbi:homoserine dehydrogenase [Thalassobaculum sp. OXR-137]|uniref:homoserine dehydrogenase n=1 Tax=Thalassobaculum sp. OXR-137 TaxID=3100173 RepID=UPI002AC953B1|nr:homoserine dehydrogenase [Thalassobaculum sp. OXR-137]WPZ37088.1 homoserine dehydrogenase [Thalassobaculum sp. OXR-137]
MGEALRVAVAGLGTVGAETVRLLAKRRDVIASHAGRPVEVVAVSARSKDKDRGLDLSGIAWADDPLALATRDDVDVVCELIGGSDGVAKTLVETAMAAGKSVVTANKALLAHHGSDLARKAETAGVTLAYEAAVAGGIPIIRALREGLVVNEVSRVYGILNGTCNYILTAMRESGRAFDDVLAEAQELGYAEADPTFDVDGIDAAHKLSLLSALAFGHAVDFDAVHTEGIRSISALDIAYAEEFGYRIKLLGIAERTPEGIRQRVHPCMVAKAAPIAQVEGVFNAVVAEGDAVGTTLHYGRGAGAGPTASAVIGDIVDIASGRGAPVFGVPADDLTANREAPWESMRGGYYVRLMVIDRPGVLADVTAIMRDQNISLESMVQRGRDPLEKVPVALTTHEVDEAAMRKALAEIARLDAVQEPPAMIRIVDL